MSCGGSKGGPHSIGVDAASITGHRGYGVCDAWPGPASKGEGLVSLLFPLVVAGLAVQGHNVANPSETASTASISTTLTDWSPREPSPRQSIASSTSSSPNPCSWSCPDGVH